MASSHTAIPEFLKFLDPHLCLNILNFYESFLTDEVATQTRRNFLFRTHLFKEQEEFLRKHNITDSDLLSQNEIKRKVDEKQEHDLKFRLTGFLNLIENNKKENEGGALSLSKKIIDETPVNKVLEYARLLYSTGRYEEASSLLLGFLKLVPQNEKNLSKITLALSMLLSINVLVKNFSGIKENILAIKGYIEKLKEAVDEEIKKTNFESAEKINFDFKEIMIYRGYLSHWALFLLEESSGLENFLDLVYDEKYFSLIEHSFDYLIKYLIIFTIISKSKQKIDILLSTLNKLVIDSTHPLANYVKLFDLVYNEYDYEGSVDVMNLCAEDMQRDYFAYKYIGLFKEKVKETILENYIRLNSTVDLNKFKDMFNEDLNETRKVLTMLITREYPDNVIKQEGDSSLSYVVSNCDSENYFVLRSQELLDVTRNMIGLLKLTRQDNK